MMKTICKSRIWEYLKRLNRMLTSCIILFWSVKVSKRPELANLTVRDNLIRIKYFCDHKIFNLDFDADMIFEGTLTHKEFEAKVPATLRIAHKEVWGDEDPHECLPFVFGMIHSNEIEKRAEKK